MQSTLSPATTQLAARFGAGRPQSRGGPLRVTALAIPNEYGWVMASVAFAAGMTQWKAIKVALARRESGVKYPAMYAEGDSEVALKFNCTQRAHQNTLETLPNVLALQMLLGLAYPIPSAALGFLWSAGRIVYGLGYSTGDPSKRTPGSAISGLTYIALILATAAVGVRTALGA